MTRTIATLLFAVTLAVCMPMTVAAQQSAADQPSAPQAPAAQPPAAPPAADNSDSVTTDKTNDANIQLMREDIRSKRRKIIASNLPLTDAEAAKFWPVYDRYITEIRKINDERYALLKEYATNYDNMTDDQADDFIERWLAFDSDDNQLRLRYIPEFQKVISHKKTAVFLQVDRRVGMMLNLQLAGQVPLVKP